MADYRVRYEIDVFDCEGHQDAAEKACDIMRDPMSLLPVLDVQRLDEDENGEIIPGEEDWTKIDLEYGDEEMVGP